MSPLTYRIERFSKYIILVVQTLHLPRNHGRSHPSIFSRIALANTLCYYRYEAHICLNLFPELKYGSAANIFSVCPCVSLGYWSSISQAFISSGALETLAYSFGIPQNKHERSPTVAQALTSKSPWIFNSDGWEMTATLTSFWIPRSVVYRPSFFMSKALNMFNADSSAPPKQYPVAPKDVTPCSLSALITLLIMERVSASPCFDNHAGKSN